jgi:Zn-finger nucleic acid-binding protein
MTTMAESPSCPSCQSALRQAGFTERCDRCEGAWIHEDALVGMLQEKTSAMVVLTWQPREPAAGVAPEPPRPCAVCGKSMQPVSLGGVALDRCIEHGVWFDARELAEVLRHAREFKADPATHPDEHRRGVIHLLERLLGVS